MKTLLLATVLTAIATPALAEDWRLVSTSADNEAGFLVDLESLKPEVDGAKRVRVLLVLISGLEQYDAVSTENVVDCKVSRQRIGLGTAYDVNGKVISKDSEGDDSWEEIAPGSNYAIVADAVCGRIAMPAEKFPGAVPVSQVRAALAKKS